MIFTDFLASPLFLGAIAWAALLTVCVVALLDGD